MALPRAFCAALACLAFVACGSRTPLTLGGTTFDAGRGSATPPSSSSGAEDAEAPPFDAAPIPPHPPTPPPWVCFGDVTTTRNVTCSVTRETSGRTCGATLVCNGDHTLTASCVDGHCTCDNPGFNTCYCDVAPDTEDACGEGNCCWR